MRKLFAAFFASILSFNASAKSNISFNAPLVAAGMTSVEYQYDLGNGSAISVDYLFQNYDSAFFGGSSISALSGNYKRYFSSQKFGSGGYWKAGLGVFSLSLNSSSGSMVNPSFSIGYDQSLGKHFSINYELGAPMTGIFLGFTF